MLPALEDRLKDGQRALVRRCPQRPQRAPQMVLDPFIVPSSIGIVSLGRHNADLVIQGYCRRGTFVTLRRRSDRVANAASKVVAEPPALGVVLECPQGAGQLREDRLLHVLRVRKLQPTPDAVLNDQPGVGCLEQAPGLRVLGGTDANEEGWSGCRGLSHSSHALAIRCGHYRSSGSAVQKMLFELRSLNGALRADRSAVTDAACRPTPQETLRREPSPTKPAARGRGWNKCLSKVAEPPRAPTILLTPRVCNQ